MRLPERLARDLARFQMALSGKWGPRGLDKQVDKYWQEWMPEVEVLLNTLAGAGIIINGDLA